MSILRDSFIWKTSFSQKEKAFPHQKDTFVASQKEAFAASQKEAFAASQKEAFAASQKEAFASVSKKDDSDSESENPIKQSAIDGSHNKPPQQKWTKQFVHWGTQEGMNSMLWMDWDDDTLQNVSEKIRKARVNRSLNQPVGFEVMASFGDNPRHVVFDASGGLKYAAF
jgi:transposase